MHGHGMKRLDNFSSGFRPFEKFDVTYIDQPYQTFVSLQNGAIDYDYFKQYKDQLVIINFSSEHWNNFENVVCKNLDNAGINFLLLTYNSANNQKYPRMFYYPYWYYNSRSFWELCYPRNIPKDTNKTYSIGCLNRKARTHRIANFLKLRKKSYWETTCVSFYNEPEFRYDELELFDNEITEWEQLQSSLPKHFYDPQVGALALADPHLIDSYLHLVTEVTASPTMFISEKTWKPVAAGVPFVMWGDVGSVSFLKNQGVDIYDDVIDHKYYDTEEDARQRLDKLHIIIDDLIGQGIDKIYSQILPRVIKNQAKFFQGEFDSNYQNTIIEAINKYK